MNVEQFQIKVIKCLGELVFTRNELNVLMCNEKCVKNENPNHKFLIYSRGKCQFSSWEIIFETKEENTSHGESVSCVRKKWQSFSLSYPIVSLLPSFKFLWVIGKNCVQLVTQDHNIRPSNVKASYIDSEDSMDVDGVCDKSRNESVKVIPKPQSYVKEIGSNCTSCPFIENGVMLCHKSKLKNQWYLQAVLPIKKRRDYDNKNIIFIAEINIKPDTLEPGEKFSKPTLLCIHPSDNSSQMQEFCMSKRTLSQLFGINPLTSFSCVCLAGLPDGRITWYTLSKQMVSIKTCEQQVLHNIGQPVLGMHITHMFQMQDKNECIVIIGALGKISFISKDALFITSTQIKTSLSSFWIATVYIPSPIYCHIMINNIMVYISSGGQLWTTILPEIKDENRTTLNIFRPISESTIFSGVKLITLVDTVKRVFSLVTFSGNFYVCELAKKENMLESSIRIPSLMNDCFQISIQLQNLEFIKSLQTKLFTAISTFASLKFSDKTGVEHVSCCVIEINTCPKKYLIDVCFNTLENLTLNSELWYLHATVHSYFQDQATVISKTAAIKISGHHMCFEVQEEAFKSSSSSMFPLSLEAGLILMIPETWNDLEGFSSLLKKLPMYLKLQTVIIHELMLVKKKPVRKDSVLQENSRNILSIIQKLSEVKPMYRPQLEPLPRMAQNELTLEFIFSISQPSVLSLFKDSPENLPKSLLIHILRKSQLRNVSDVMCKYENGAEISLSCKDQAITLSASQTQNNIIIKLSADSFNVLVGLRIGIIENLLNSNRAKESTFVIIPASINRKCEDISATITKMLSENMESAEYRGDIFKVYKTLRKEVSNRLPFF